MHDHWTDQLSGYLDGELGVAEEEALGTHVQSCAECRRVLAELAEVRRAARALTPAPPAADLWPGVAARLELARNAVPLERRRRFIVPRAIAAGIALLLLGGTGAWWLRGLLDNGRGEGTTTSIPRPATDSISEPLSVADVRIHEAAAAELAGVLARNQSRLDTATVRIVTENLTIINRAIAEAKRALAADSANPYVRQHLRFTRQRKLELLRNTAALAAAQS